MGLRGPKAREPIERFRDGKYAVTEDGCWEWKAMTNTRYPLFWYGPAEGRGYAHRWSYEFHVGPIPDGMEIDHLCRNTLCVNPDHLEPVTRQENQRRYADTITHCPQGHPYDEGNTGWYRNSRKCKQCAREARRSPGYVPPADRTHCGNGHPRTPENTYFDPKRGVRACRICRREAAARARERRVATEAVDHFILEHGFDALDSEDSIELDIIRTNTN